jgi:hypothetical protein
MKYPHDGQQNTLFVGGEMQYLHENSNMHIVCGWQIVILT